MYHSLIAAAAASAHDPFARGLSSGAAPRRTGLDGVRVLLVEDEFLVAALLEEMLEGFGCQVVASVTGVAEALDVMAREPLDAAVLDVNLGAEMVFPVAAALEAAGTPFLFSTAYGRAGVPPRFSARPVLEKPYQERALEQVLSRLLADAAAG